MGKVGTKSRKPLNTRVSRVGKHQKKWEHSGNRWEQRLKREVKMEKDSKWYKAIQILFDVAKQYGDVQVKDNDDEMTRVYKAVKEEAQKHDPFIRDLLMAFVGEKKREWGR